MARLVLIAALFVAALSFEFALHYEGKCSNGQVAHCHGKAQSIDIKTRISATGSVHSEHKKLIGSISNMLTDATFDPVKNVDTLVGNLTFGTHNTHNDHLLYFTGSGAVLYTSAAKHIELDAGYFNITGGEGAFKNHRGAASYTCHNEPKNADRFSCWVVGHVFKH